MDHLISVRSKRSWPAVHVPQGSAGPGDIRQVPFSTGVTSYPSEERRFIQESGSAPARSFCAWSPATIMKGASTIFFRMKAVGSPEKGVQGWIGFYSSKKNIFYVRYL